MTESKFKASVSNKVGAITFLDVLGWKGIWQRKDDAVADLQTLARLIDKTAKNQSRGLSKNGFHEISTWVLIVSDTIVISTEISVEKAQEVLELHGILCQKAIPASIEMGIPVRGATSFGEFLIDSEEKILVGKAIDEAASWHEAADWIGVFMTPSAAYIFDVDISKFWIEYEPPLKNLSKLQTKAVKWFKPNKKPKDEFMALQKNFALMSPIVPEISSKFQNTIQFVQKIMTKK